MKDFMRISDLISSLQTLTEEQKESDIASIYAVSNEKSRKYSDNIIFKSHDLELTVRLCTEKEPATLVNYIITLRS